MSAGPNTPFPSPVYTSNPAESETALNVPQPHIAQLIAAPTEADFNGLLTALQNAGILAAA